MKDKFYGIIMMLPLVALLGFGFYNHPGLAKTILLAILVICLFIVVIFLFAKGLMQVFGGRRHG